MVAVADRVKETTTTTGTGTLSLGGAATGFQAFSAAFASGTQVEYCTTDGTNWEVGIGTATTGTPWTLSRDIILASSNAGSAVNWGAGSKDVFCTRAAAHAMPTLPTFDCTQASGALTFSMSPQMVTFRNATTTSGTPHQMYAVPANLVLPSGGSLGVPTTQSGRIIVALMDYVAGGTAELAIMNQTGGLPVDEEGVISTTAVSASSTANNVWYSTTARTNLAYKIVFAIDAVWTTGGTGWASPTNKVGAGGNVLLKSYPLLRLSATNGYGSTNTKIRRWTNVLSNTISSFATYADSATLGMSITILVDGIYSVQYSDQFNALGVLGLSLNTSAPTTAIYSIPDAEIIALASSTTANSCNGVNINLPLRAGDIVRTHTDGASTGASVHTLERFSITKIG